MCRSTMPGAPCKAYIYMTSTVQRGRGWVVVGRVERVVALSEVF